MDSGGPRNFVHVETLILRIAFCNPGNLASTRRTLIFALRFSSEGPSSESRGSTHTQRSGGFQLCAGHLRTASQSCEYHAPTSSSCASRKVTHGQFQLPGSEVTKFGCTMLYQRAAVKNPYLYWSFFDHDSQSSIDSGLYVAPVNKEFPHQCVKRPHCRAGSQRLNRTVGILL